MCREPAASVARPKSRARCGPINGFPLTGGLVLCDSLSHLHLCARSFRAATVLILIGKGFIKPLLGNFSFCVIKQTCNRQPLQQLAPLQPLRRFKCSGPPSQPHDFPIAAVKSVRNFIIKETKIPVWPFDVSRGRCQIATPATLGSWGRWRHALSATHPLALSVVPRGNPLHQPKLTRCNLCS